VCIYQGEELGLREADVPFESLRDPYGKAFWPKFKGRDGCRTPLPWTDAPRGGFSTGTPWLPVPTEQLALAVEVQEREPSSTLHAFRRFIHWRRQHPALLWGDIDFLVATGEVLAFTRHYEGERILAAFNLSVKQATADLPRVFAGTPLAGHGLPEGKLEGARLTLPPHGVLYLRLAP
jgi:alpha-glucosidase